MGWSTLADPPAGTPGNVTKMTYGVEPAFAAVPNEPEPLTRQCHRVAGSVSECLRKGVS